MKLKVANQLTQPIEVISLSIGKSSWNAGSIINSNSESLDNSTNSNNVVIPASFNHLEKTSEAIFQIPVNKEIIFHNKELKVNAEVQNFWVTAGSVAL